MTVPVALEEDYLRLLDVQREAMASRDPLLCAIRSGDRSDPREVIHAAVICTSQETAALKFDRLVLEEQGKDISQVSSRRVDGLYKIAHVLVESKKLGLLDPSEGNSQIRKVEALWMDVVKQAAFETLPSETGTAFLDRVMAGMTRWREAVQDQCAGIAAR
jgi:hypothetical protein